MQHYFNFINPNIFFALFLALLFYILGSFAAKRTKNPILNIVLILIFTILSIPAFTFIFYYLHLTPLSEKYVQYRANNQIEVLSGLFAGLIAYISGKYFKGFFRRLIFRIPLTLLLVLVPYLKPIVTPIRRPLPDDWKDNVCLQSYKSTCGPSSLATIFKYYGIDKTEQELAEQAHSCATGTEIWYLIRYARDNGFRVQYKRVNSISEVSIPSIIGTTLRGTVGHFVTLLGKENGYYIIGDPLKGKLKLSESEFNNNYKLDFVSYYITKL